MSPPILEKWQITSAGGLDLFALVILGLGIMAGIIWTWRSLDPGHPLKHRVIITLLRALALFMGLGLLLQPTFRIRKIKKTPSAIAFVVDTSHSMTRQGETSRLNQIATTFKQSGKALEKLAAGHRLVWYRFADELEQVESLEQAVAISETSSSRMRNTDIRKALTSLNTSTNDIPLGAVVLVSDGADTKITTTKEDRPDVSWATKVGVPINTLLAGGSRGVRDLAIEQVRADSFAFSRNETPIAVSLSAVGLPDGPTDAFLWQDGSVVQRRTVDLVGGKASFTFTMVPSRLGHHVLTVTVPPSPEDEIPENNKAHLNFEVTRDKFRILHLVGQPSWDQRFLRQALKSWPKVDLVSFYILRTAHQSHTLGSSGMSLIPFPTKDIFESHLDEFDVLIFQGFDPSIVGVDKYLDKIARFIENGGALVIIAGNRGLDASGMASEELNQTLPIRLLPPGKPGSAMSPSNPSYNTESFRLKLTKAGEQHPLLQFSDISSMAVKPSTQFKEPLHGTARIAGLNEEALSLAEHTFLDADDGPIPVIAVKETGKGRTVSITTSSMWRWDFTSPMNGGPSGSYPAFWKQCIKWLTHDPGLDRLRVKVHPSPVEVGATTNVDIEVLDLSYRPVPGIKVDVEISWFDDEGVQQKDTFQAGLDDQGRHRRQWSPVMDGPHLLTVTVPDLAKQKAEQRFLVNSTGAELSHLEPWPQLLEAISEATGGKRLQSNQPKLDELEIDADIADEVQARVDESLWDHPITLVLFLGLLSIEWILRRRLGLR